MELAFVQIHFDPDKPVDPMFTHDKLPFQKSHTSRSVGAAKVNHLALRRFRVVTLPSFREWSSLRCRYDFRLVRESVCLNIFRQTPHDFLHAFELFATPEFFLEFAIEPFDLALESLFIRRRKNGDHFQRQAKSDHFSDRVLLSRPLEDHVVVKLCVLRQAELSPVLDQRKYRVFRNDRVHRHRMQQVAMQRNPVEELHFLTAVQVQTFEDVEAVEFMFSLLQARQIPTGRRCGPTHSRSPVEHPVSLEDVADGPTCRHIVIALPEHFIANRIGSVKSEDTFFLEVFSEYKDAFFELGGGLVFRFFRTGFFIVKVDAIKSHSFGERDPSLHGGFGFAEVFRDLPERTPRPVSGDHTPPFVRNVADRFCLSC